MTELNSENNEQAQEPTTETVETTQEQTEPLEPKVDVKEKKKYKMIGVRLSTYERLMEDKEHFKQTIGSKKWSISDVIDERSKILKLLEDKQPN